MVKSNTLRHLWSVLETDSHTPCLVHGEARWTRRDLLDARDVWAERLGSLGGTVVGIESGFHLDSIALLLAIWKRGGVGALLPVASPQRARLIESARVESWVAFDSKGDWNWSRVTPPDAARPPHPLLEGLRASGGSGFVIFSSGSTGRPKAVLHDAQRFLGKFVGGGKALRTLTFLLFDHIAGLDTLCYTLASGGTLVLPEGRDPESICRVIEAQEVEVLPVSPTFLNLLLLSGAAESFDLSSVKIVTYGSEPMSQHTLDRASEILPGARFIQKYGTSEFGAPRALSQGDGSLWIQLKPDETEMRVIDGVLWIRSPAAMLGYLNAPSPFDEEGWLCTGDLVEEDGDWIRILGRESDLIIIGGEKVTPAEVEAAIEELDWVIEASVHGEPHPLVGAMVVATVRTDDRNLDSGEVRRAVRKHCRTRLPPHKVPQKVVLETGSLSTERQKKRRGPADGPEGL